MKAKEWKEMYATARLLIKARCHRWSKDVIACGETEAGKKVWDITHYHILDMGHGIAEAVFYYDREPINILNTNSGKSWAMKHNTTCFNRKYPRKRGGR